MLMLRSLTSRLVLTSLFTTIVLNQSPAKAYGGDTLKKLEREIIGFLDSSKVSVVTVASKFSHEINVEKRSSLFSFSRTEVEKKSISYKNIGSGFIFDSEGHILTRSSIVVGSDFNMVMLSNGTEVPAELVGDDPESGFAVLKIDADSLVPAHLGDSDSVLPGAWIMVIGNSLGVYPSMVFGNVNGLRSDGIIQISAVLDAGNNGSPIFNTNGEVIGVVAARLNTGEGVMEAANYNVSQTTLVYPINWIKRITKDIIRYGQVRKGWLGVIGNQDGTKLVVRRVVDESPAQKAGLNRGDVIVKFGGEKINNISQLAYLVRYSQPGEKVSLEYMRDGQQEDVTVELGAKRVSEDSQGHGKASAMPSVNRNASSLVEKNKLLEMRIDNLEKELAELKKELESN